jgi:hypothetical protein
MLEVLILLGFHFLFIVVVFSLIKRNSKKQSLELKGENKS